ncbi:hypothetical protein T12_12184 [Trichinella patagoniensis]|uniref:Uncharacterized protein n=1 Tax=Trichinella patagoniensis TaxID=990121 RepID=A0A0V0YZB4_9BILA|nr:hypothetical protein T12_12184 [Trichinella patagoniensis]
MREVVVSYACPASLLHFLLPRAIEEEEEAILNSSASHFPQTPPPFL